MSLRRRLYAQFAKPQGLLGRLVGAVLAASNRERARWTLSLLEIRPGDRLLDVGCGPGVALELALKDGRLASATGLDHSATVLEQARRRLASAHRSGRVELIEGSLNEPSLEGPRFDRICSMNVIQFLSDKAEALARLKSLLKPGGRLATTYQPRGSSPTREAAMAMAETLVGLMETLGFVRVRVEVLELRPAPAVCVLGDLPGEAS
jgi:ubiquinone/menaquinone biosynthesis C-methylase UbiE